MGNISKAQAKKIELLLDRIKAFRPKFENNDLLQECQAKLDEYNQKVAQIDALRAQLRKEVDRKNDLGKMVNSLVRRLKDAVGVQYGYDANEYELVGRTRDSERKRPAPEG